MGFMNNAIARVTGADVPPPVPPESSEPATGLAVVNPPAALAIVPQPVDAGALTLYEIEENLLALAESAAMVAPEEEEQFLAELSGMLTAAVEKRDRVGHFLAHCEGQTALADQEIKRLQERKAMFQRARARMEDYLVRIIKAWGPVAKGKYRKLEGNTVTLSIQKNPASVEIQDEASVPTEYKIVTLKLPAAKWEALLDSLDLEERAALLDAVKSPDVSIDKKAVKAAIDAKTPVAGADLCTDKYRLVVK